MECRDVSEILSAYLDGVLTDDEKTGVEEHIRTCAHCSSVLDDIRNAVITAKKLQEIEPPSGLSRKVMNKIKAETREKGLLSALFFPLHIKVPLEAFAVIAIAVTALYLYKSTEPDIQRVRPEAPKAVSSSQPTAVPGKARLTEEHPRSPAEKPVPPTTMKSLDMREQRDAGIRALKEQEMNGLKKQLSVISIFVDDIDIASLRIDEIVRDLRGEITGRESLRDKSVITLSVDAGAIDQFMKRLESVGRAEGPVPEFRSDAASLEIKLELVQSP